MAKQTLVMVGLVIVGLVSQACTIGSDTYITAQEGAAPAKDAGASSATTASATASTSTCSASDFAKPDLGKLTACGEGKGHCYEKTKVPFADQLTACPNAAEVCVPDEILEARGNPLKSCTTIVPSKGACITATLMPAILEQGGSVLKPDVCDPDQKCVPCVNPLDKKDTGFCAPTGVHENACVGAAAEGAAAKPAATPSVPCCTTNGKSNGVCIPETTIPEAQRDQAPSDTCGSGNKCAPAAFVAGKPVTCKGGLFGSGVCMDKCFNGMMSLAGGLGLLDSEGCGQTEVCVPCTFLSGQNVPGCS